MRIRDEPARLFEALAAHTPVGVFVSRADGECVYVNERWCELTGLTAEPALLPDDAARVSREWGRLPRRVADSIVEHRFLRPDGSSALPDTRRPRLALPCGSASSLSRSST